MLKSNSKMNKHAEKDMKQFLDKINKLNLMKKEYEEIKNNVKSSMQEFLPEISILPINGKLSKTNLF